MIFGLFKKVTPEKLIDHASGLFEDKNNFKVYFDDFNENYIDDNEESYEIFQRNWKAIIYTIVKGVYQRFGSNKINQYEYMQIIAGLLGKIVDINNPNPDDKKLFDQYEKVYMNGGFDIANILSDNCFNGLMNEKSINKVRTSIDEFESFFEDSVNAKFK